MDPVSRLGGGGRGRKRALQYAEAGVETGVRLLEVADEALLAAVLAGETCLRAGGADQEAALCTADRTFGLKRTDTSNLLLLLNGGGGSGGGAPATPGALAQPPPATPGATATSAGVAVATPSPVAVRGTQWEGLATQQARAQGLEPLIVCATCVDTLQTCGIPPAYALMRGMISARPFGAGADLPRDTLDSGEACGVSFRKLLEVARLSEDSLRAWLLEEHYLELEDRWMQVDAEYMHTLLSLVLCEALQEGWPTSALPVEGVVRGMAREGYRREVVENCLDRFCVRERRVVGQGEGVTGRGSVGTEAEAEAEKGEVAGDLKALNIGAVCKFMAEKLFREQARWNFDEFSAQLLKSLREVVLDADLPPTEEFLGGVALQETVRKYGKDFKEVEFFPVAALSPEPKERFKELFQRRANWRQGELQPYLTGLAIPADQTLDQEVAKWSRSFNVDGDAEKELIYYHRW